MPPRNSSSAEGGPIPAVRQQRAPRAILASNLAVIDANMVSLDPTNDSDSEDDDNVDLVRRRTFLDRIIEEENAQIAAA